MDIQSNQPGQWQPVEDAEAFFLYIEANRIRLARGLEERDQESDPLPLDGGARLFAPYVADYVLRAKRRIGGDGARGEAPLETGLEIALQTVIPTVIEKFLSRFDNSGRTYAVFADPEGQREGVLWFLESEVRGDHYAPGGRRLFCLYQPLRGRIRAVNPAVLWDLQPLAAGALYNDFANRPLLNLLQDPAFVEKQFASNVLRSSQRAPATGRRLLGAALVLWSRPDLPQVRAVDGAKGVGIFDVRPTWDAWEWMDPERKRAVDQAGKQAAMAYERDQGRQAQDVSGGHHGFDLRSVPAAGDQSAVARYIAVKARARSGAIRLSANECKMARHYREQYWLYIVTHATDSPQLQPIQDPATKLAIDGDVLATGFIVPQEAWQHE